MKVKAIITGTVNSSDSCEAYYAMEMFIANAEYAAKRAGHVIIESPCVQEVENIEEEPKKYQTFKDLKFHVNPNGGLVGKVTASNGYEISVAMTQGTYGGNLGLWEICVFEGPTSNKSIKMKCLNGGDVEGWLDVEAVSKKIIEVQKEIDEMK